MEVYLRTYIPKPSPHRQPQRSAQLTQPRPCPALSQLLHSPQLQDIFPFHMPRPIYIPTHTSRLTGVLTHTPLHLNLPPFMYLYVPPHNHHAARPLPCPCPCPPMPPAPCPSPRPWFNLTPLVAFHSKLSLLLSATAPRPLPPKLADFGLSSACVSGTAQACASIFFWGFADFVFMMCGDVRFPGI